MPLSPRAGIAGLEPATHGGVNYAEFEELGIAPDSVLDFSVCVNPYGPPPGVREAMASASIERYPDSESTALRRRLAAKLGVPEGTILVGSGSTEIIRLAAFAYLAPGDAALIPSPSYGDYEVACAVAGATVFKLPRALPPDLRFTPNHLVSAIARYQPRLVFLGNPNNPTGQYLSEPDMQVVLHGARQALVVLDEAYLSFSEGAWPSHCLIGRDNLLVVRSMTKDYALAGLRLGYALGHESVIAALHKAQPPWSVSAVAQEAGLAALASTGYLERCRRNIATAKAWLIPELETLGFAVVPSAANYFMVKVGDAARFRAALLPRGILVRDCASFGFPEYVRLGVRTLPECRQLVCTMRSAGVRPR